MSDFQMLSLVLMMFGIITPLIIALIDAKK